MAHRSSLVSLNQTPSRYQSPGLTHSRTRLETSHPLASCSGCVERLIAEGQMPSFENLLKTIQEAAAEIAQERSKKADG